MRNFTDEELTAYLDGEHEFAPVAEIDAALRVDQTLQQRLDNLAVDKASITSAFDALLRQAPASPEFAPPQVKSVATPWYRQAVAAALLLAMGMGLGNWLTMPDARAWQDYAAAYHVLYGKDTLSNLQPTTEVATLELKRVSDALGKSLSSDTLASASELTYKRAQILAYDGQPLIQVAFLSSAGDPVAFCITRSNAVAKMKVGQHEGLASAIWSRDGYDFMLIGGKDQNLIEAAAKKLSAAI